MADHELVIRLGRPFDVQIGGRWHEGAREITIPFARREDAEGAQREVQLFVRQVHDAGGEHYRTVVQGSVERPGTDLSGRVADAIRGDPDLMSRLTSELDRHDAVMRRSILAPKPDLGDPDGDLRRDLRDLAELNRLAMARVGGTGEGTVRTYSDLNGFTEVSTKVTGDGVLQVTSVYQAIIGGDDGPAVIGWHCTRREARLDGALVTDPYRAQRLAEEAGILSEVFHWARDPESGRP